MRRAILYIRVSTDEQADKGYSQRNQDEALQKYCGQQHIAITDVIYEDHSAKTFNRPEWKKMLTALKKRKGGPGIGLLLFTKWDRFSRNTADAYQMIAELRRMGIEPQAIEQPLDLSVPENKMMLAFYLAVPEVENDRRALNIMQGIRRAKKEGRWMGMAPVGYVNRSTELGDKYIRLDEPQATLMKSAFAQIATGEYSVEQVWQRTKQQGLRGSKQNFWYNIRNPIYCGKVVVPAHQDEPAYLADGQHEPMITVTLFEQVQMVLQRRKRIRPTRRGSEIQYPLRGFLSCPVCGRRLTASGSRGRAGCYHYYHCTASCGIRYRAKDMEAELVKCLRQFNAKRPYLNLFIEIIKDTWKLNALPAFQRRQQLHTLVDQQSLRITKARDLLLNGNLDPDDYQHIKLAAEGKLRQLRDDLATLADPQQQINALLEHRKDELLDLGATWQNSDLTEQRQLFRFLFPTNIIYSSQAFKLTALPPAIRAIIKHS